MEQIDEFLLTSLISK